MKRETAESLVNVLGMLANHTSESWMKLQAMERALATMPMLRAAYDEELRELRRDPKIRADHQESAQVLSRLLEALAQDH